MVIRKSVCVSPAKAKYITLIITLELIYATSETNNADIR